MGTHGSLTQTRRAAPEKLGLGKDITKQMHMLHTGHSTYNLLKI